MRFGPKLLFAGVDLQLMPGFRYGLVGANGSGKSTFLRILSGEEAPVGGSVQIPTKAKVGILRQDHFKFDENTLMDSVLQGKPKLHQAMTEMAKLLDKEDFNDEDGERVGHLESTIAEEDGYSAEADAAVLLEGLGLPSDRHDRKMKELSGGYKLRVLLAQTLFSDPDILFLDEPTNHLDLYSIQWLEGYLKRYNGVLVVISHDRDFINGVSTHILDVDYGSVSSYKGNYDAFLKQFELEKERREAAVEKTERRKGELQGFVDRFRAKATKAKQAQSKMRMIEKLDDELDSEQVQPSSRRRLPMGFAQKRPSGVIALKVKKVSKAYGELKVLENVDFELERADRVAILGPNGIGKSTLLKILAEGLEAQGSFEWGHGVTFSYFPQDIEAEVRGSGTALDWIRVQCPGVEDGQLRKILARALFSGDDSGKSIGTLSGGERARLILARMMASGANVLIFDEPTNHLDLEAIESLCDALEAFEGTLLIVSHNRWFVSRLANRILEILPGETRLHEGGYEIMLESSSDDHLDRSALKRSETKETEEAPAKEELSPEQKKKKKELQNQMSRLETRIAQLEQQLASFDDEMSEPSFYDEENAWKMRQTIKKRDGVISDLDAFNSDWEAAGEEIEALS